MGAAVESGAAWTLGAVPAVVGQMRRHAGAFTAAAGASEEIVQAVALAVSEAVTNAVVHAYAGREPGPVTVRCRADGGSLVVDVVDEGRGIAVRPTLPVPVRAWRSSARWRRRCTSRPGPGERAPS